VRGAAINNYHRIKKRIIKAGAYGTNISGGGSSIFAVCDENKQDKIAELMHESYKDNPYFVKVIKTHTSNLGVREIE